MIARASAPFATRARLRPAPSPAGLRPRKASTRPCECIAALALSAGCLDGAEPAAPIALPSDAAPACALRPAAPPCGDPCAEGVRVGEDVTTNTVWDCPLYTLASPIYVRSESLEPARLVIAPGTVIQGLSGELEAGRLPGALIVTRSGRIDARGTRSEPIVFTSARPPGSRAPGDWGGVVLLGRASTNVPANFEGSGNRAGEMYIEGLPRSPETTYGASSEPALDDEAGQSADAGAAGDAGASDTGGAVPNPAGPNAWRPPDPDHDCGALRYVRIEFAGFEVGDTNELNGLTVGACGRRTLLDYVQVHLGSDDGIEFFGGNADLRHALITGSSDDALDWDQGWVGRVQFLSVVPFGGGESDNGFEGDGFADAESPSGAPSAPVMYNVTLLAGERASRAIRLREGSRLELRNAIVAAPSGGPLEGLIDIGDALTADQLTLGLSRVNASILQGAWPISARADSSGYSYLAEDYFTIGAGAHGNTVLARDELELLLPGAADPEGPWLPRRGSHASRDWELPANTDESRPFFDASATYRGAFDPSGEDWTEGWTAYPPR